MMPIQKTCTCIEDFELDEWKFIKKHEYQVDICPVPLCYKVYNNGGWLDYVNIDEETFNKNFKLIV